MTIAAAIKKHYPNLSAAQQQIVGHIKGPLLVIAGPGSGKTLCIVLRTLNLLLLKKADPNEVVLCTFTEKAAYEMRDRLAAYAKELGYDGDLSQLRVTTIHSLCNQILTEFRHMTPLGHSYETLDELTQSLFFNEHFEEIVGPEESRGYLGRWSSKWAAISGLQKYLDKLTEELVDVDALAESPDPFHKALAAAHRVYEERLIGSNRVDFAHQQRWAFELLSDPKVSGSVTRGVAYLLVDEYQDTNHIQEQLLLKLASRTGNLCVVGDEDQSLYRFRGATVRNILEFPTQVEGCRLIELTTNYRSHRQIVAAYDRWMASGDWSNAEGLPFRYDKTIVPDPERGHRRYPALFCIWGQGVEDEAQRLADLVTFLKTNDAIQDYSQVALLLHSVRQEHSGPYLDALDAVGVPAYCPRARSFFENDEVRWMVACLAVIFGWYEGRRGETSGAVARLATYVDEALVDLGRRFGQPHPLGKLLEGFVTEVEGLKEREGLDLRPADYLYRLLAVDPFASAVKSENRARRLAVLSQLLNTFQTYYHYSVVTHANREALRFHLFSSFLRLLHEGGMNEYEDPDQPFPTGFVQVMTIHQAKGLEFPVVVVGSLSKQIASQKQVDRDLEPFYHRPPFEPEGRITHFDRMRLHYVAFSRPQDLLVLTAHEAPKDYFAPIWQGLPQWPYVEKERLAVQRFGLRERMPVKRTYSFTGDVKVYETCPRQYEFFRYYDFTPSRSAVIFFGLLVHQTIEEIHRIVLDGGAKTLSERRIAEIFDRTFRFLTLSDVRPIGATAREAALAQVLNYVRQNKAEMQRVVETEVDVSVEKGDYILKGKVDLLLGGDGKLELLDFKSSPRPKDNRDLIAAYERQLCTYAHILERKHGRHVDRLLLYWTSEPKKDDALMVLPYERERVDEAGRYFDEIVRRIQAREFSITARPEAGICKECDLRHSCTTEGL